VLNDRSVIGSVYLLCPSSVVKPIINEINSTLTSNNDVLAGASVMPYSSGMIVRLLGDGASALRAAIFDIIRISRKSILNAEFSGIRKG
ncbi:MAG TPA: urease accessory protein UreD, partial [Nitrososphaeraceae archaeon]|nr:urease accessory protein UreD [Nitrososphaeraceae archaeon]